MTGILDTRATAIPKKMQAGVRPNCRMSGRHRFRCYLSETVPRQNRIYRPATNERTKRLTDGLTNGQVNRQTDGREFARVPRMRLSRNVVPSTLFRRAGLQPVTLGISLRSFRGACFRLALLPRLVFARFLVPPGERRIERRATPLYYCSRVKRLARRCIPPNNPRTVHALSSDH